MSSTSIQDEGYTPPDFLEKLFKRTSTASSQNVYRPLTSISNISNLPSTNYFSSSPLIPISQNKYSPSKLHRTHSLNQEERITTKKFKIFYNTVLEGIYPEIQALEIWQRFEKSLSNPFEYDKFIEELRLQKQAQKKQNNQQTLMLSDLKLQQLPKKSYSSQKYQLKNSRSNKSLEKYDRNEKNEKQKMKKNIKYIRSILKHGEKYIKTN